LHPIFLARGLRDRVDVDKVYGKVEMKGFDDPQQARAELIPLEQQRLQRIQYDLSTTWCGIQTKGCSGHERNRITTILRLPGSSKYFLNHLFIFVTLIRNI
jgi:hypothetical protein